MVKKSVNLLSGITNAKTRTFVIFFGAIIIIGIGVAITRNRSASNEDPLSKQGSQAVAVPTSIKSTPGSTVSEQYRELQVAENDRRAQEALKKKTSAIPTIIGAISETSQTGPDQSLPSLESALQGGKQGQGTNHPENAGFAGTDAFGSGRGIGGPGSSGGIGGTGSAGGIGSNPLLGNTGLGTLGGGKSAQERAREEQEARIRAERERLDKMRSEKEAQLRRDQAMKGEQMQQEQEKKTYEASVQKMSGQMKTYAQGAYLEWSKFPVQTFVQGTLTTKEQPPSEGERGKGASNKSEKNKTKTNTSGSQKTKSIIKAGTVLFGIMDTAVNSDENSPILATVVSGKYQGSKLIGSFQHTGQAEAIVVSFSQMSLPKASNSIGVQAVAIDPDTARTALASDVDRHYLLRYGSLFASAFLTGYGSALQQQGSTTTTSPLTGATTTSYPPLDNRQIFLSALAQVGTQWGQATRTYFSTPYTVTVDQGAAIGVLFLSDIDVSSKD